jgi:hypothetical protein
VFPLSHLLQMLVVVRLDDYLALRAAWPVPRGVQRVFNFLNDQIPTLTTRWDEDVVVS